MYQLLSIMTTLVSDLVPHKDTLGCTVRHIYGLETVLSSETSDSLAGVKNEANNLPPMSATALLTFLDEALQDVQQ